ncbi:unnamed protein product, partial [marine sediment metagenome]
MPQNNLVFVIVLLEITLFSEHTMITPLTLLSMMMLSSTVLLD